MSEAQSQLGKWGNQREGIEESEISGSTSLSARIPPDENDPEFDASFDLLNETQSNASLAFSASYSSSAIRTDLDSAISALAAAPSLKALNRLGDFVTETHPANEQASTEQRLFVMAAAVSALLHSALLTALLLVDSAESEHNAMQTEQLARAESIAVRLVAENPLRFEAEPEDRTARATSTAEELTSIAPAPEEFTDVGAPEAQALVHTESIERADVLETTAADESAIADSTIDEANEEATASNATESSGREQVVPTVATAPTIASMRNSIQQLHEQSQARAWRQQCNPLQEEAELLDCGEGAQSDYSAARRNTTYAALNPTFTQGRAQRTLPTIAMQRDTLLAQLEEADVPEWQRDYVAQQLEMTISEGSATGNRTVRQIIEMTDKSEAAQRAKMLFDDPWQIQAERDAIKRDVHRQ